jgi:glycosyltransferase involved in cell wall biosynthesis
MIIALDARTAYAPARRGIGKSLIDLYRGVAAMRPEWRFVMFRQVDGPDDPFAGLANVEHRRIDIPGDRFGLWQQVRLPLAARKAGATLLHCPANTAPRWPLVPMVVTIHDLIPLEPEFMTRESQKWGRNVAAAARKARRIMTPSEYSKRQIIKIFGIEADKILVNPWAPDAACRRVTDAAELERVRRQYGLTLDRPYVFGFGAPDPRKNTRRILRAWARLPERLRAAHALLLVGMTEPALAEFRKDVKDLGLEGSCILCGFAAEQDIPALLSGAAALCYPSLSEGFGLPVLDAFACQTAVLTSNVTSLPEVAGDAAILVDPYREDSITRGMEEILADEATRRELVRRGCQRLSLFGWETCVERACRTFEEAVAC